MKTKFLALVLASTVAFSANAAVEGSWSTGIAGGWQHAFDSDFGLGVDSRGLHYKSEVSDKNGFDIKLDGEYNFTDWFGLGVSYDYLKGVKINDGFKKSNVHTDVASVYGRFALPIDANGSDVFFKVGPTYNWVNGYSDAKDKIGAVFGIGGQWAVNKSLAIRAGYDYLLNTVRSENRPDKINSGLLYLGLQYNFGASPAPAPVAAPAP
ncbi:MAG: outer membrane beta-barrel protein, partial [Succinivibrio sp.]